MQWLRQSWFKSPSPLRQGAFLALVVGLLGCKREEIRVYTIPKEQPQAVARSGRGAMPAAPHIHYQAPDGWIEQDPGGLLARFKVPAKERDIDVSAIALPGKAPANEVLNLMRREQVGLEPLSEEEMARLAEKVAVGNASGELFDMVSNEPVLQQAHKARILIALVKQDDLVWYFRMGGEDESVRNEKPKFLEFLKSVEFDDSDHSAGSSQFTSTNTGETGGNSKPMWEVPPAWKEAPPSQLLLAKFLVPGEGARKVEVTVSVFPQDAGGVLDNVNRWRGQLGLPAVAAGELEKVAKPLDTPQTKGVLVDMSGTDVKTGQKARLIAAIVPQGDRTWFYKLMGDEQIAEREREAFVKFVQTAKHPNG